MYNKDTSLYIDYHEYHSEASLRRTAQSFDSGCHALRLTHALPVGSGGEGGEFEYAVTHGYIRHTEIKKERDRFGREEDVMVD